MNYLVPTAACCSYYFSSRFSFTYWRAHVGKKEKPPPPPTPTFTMPSPNDTTDIYKGALHRLRRTNPAHPAIPGGSLFGVPDEPVGADWRFLEGRWFEQLLDQDQGVQAAVQKAAGVGYNEKAMERIQAAILRVFEEVYLVQLVDLFDAIAPTVAQFMAARHAYYRLHPEELQPAAAIAPPLDPA